MSPALHRGAAVPGLLLCSFAALPGCTRRAPTPADTLRVAAAADLAFAFTEIGDAFARRGGPKPAFTFGSTGLLSKQIEQGAPFDVFAAASRAYADDVVRASACDGATRAEFARGRLVLWFRSGSVPAPPASLAGLSDRRFRRIAIANPEHAPYGRAAEQALEHAGVWEAVKPRLVYGENVQQALEFGRTGNADAAIVAMSLAITTPEGVYLAVDPSYHAPIEQVLVVCNRGKKARDGMRFAEFVQGVDGRAILKKYGFSIPSGTEQRR